MEGITQIKNVSEVINIRNFLQQWESTTHIWPEDDEPASDSAERIAHEMNVPLDTVKELETVCGIDTLRHGDEPLDLEMMENIPENLDLVSVKIQQRELQKREESLAYRNTIKRKMKYKYADDKLVGNYQEIVKNRITLPDTVKVAHPDVILAVHIHLPFHHVPSTPNCKILLDQSYLVLGSQKLTELRDKITCVNDLAVAGDLSENPDDVTRYYAKDIYKSGFFYFEGTFYNDMREPECRDYSEVVRNWGGNPSNMLGPHKWAKMEDCTFMDLDVRLGYPYVYQHQGDCEHIIVISDLRLLHPEDSLDIRDYPKLIKKKRDRRTPCRACTMHTARWVVHNSEYAPENPCFLCDQCFKALHYDTGDNKIGNFSAYRYFDSHAVI